MYFVFSLFSLFFLLFSLSFLFFFFIDTAPTVFYPLSLHDALPISLMRGRAGLDVGPPVVAGHRAGVGVPGQDRKSTRLNSSHVAISYAVFCLKKKKKRTIIYALSLRGPR